MPTETIEKDMIISTLEEYIARKQENGFGLDGKVLGYGFLALDVKLDISDESEWEKVAKENNMRLRNANTKSDEMDVIHKDRVIPFVASNENTDRDGDVLRVDGWDFKSYKDNPVFMRNHDRYADPIGRVIKIEKVKGLPENIFRNGKALVIHVHFPTEEISADADKYFKMYKSRLLNSVSIGFMPLEFNNPTDEKERKRIGLGKFGVEITKAEVFEVSAVNIPANPQALMLLGVSDSEIGRLEALRSAIDTTNKSAANEEEKPSTDEAKEEPVTIDGKKGEYKEVKELLTKFCNTLNSVLSEFKCSYSSILEKESTVGSLTDETNSSANEKSKITSEQIEDVIQKQVESLLNKKKE